MENGENKNKGKSKGEFIKIGIYVLAGIVILGLACSSFYFYRQYKKASETKPQNTRDELAVLTDEIKRVMDLPDEVPTLATVTDIEQAKNQPFFAKAANGDKVLIYANAKKAILYRPSEKRIIEVANVSGLSQDKEANQADISQPSSETGDTSGNISNESQPSSEVQQRLARVAIYNGANIKNLAANIAERLSSVEGIEITEKTNAKENYGKTIVIDLSGNNSEAVNKIVEAIGGEAGELPQGEIKPDADILVIGGKE